MTREYTTMDSPIGELLLLGNGHALSGLFIQDGRRPIEVGPSWRRANESFDAARSQLDEYFDGSRRAFELQLEPSGTPFQLRVWLALREIPYGETISYGELARGVDRPSAARAVGLANGHNPISIVVPCHRVIGADGSLTGYGGGVERKRQLLELEAGTLALAA